MAEWTVTTVGHGAYRVTGGQRSRLAYAAGPPDARWVFLEGRVYVVNVEARSAEALRHRETGSGSEAVVQSVGPPGPAAPSGTLNPVAPSGTLNPVAPSGTLNPVAQRFSAARGRQNEGTLAAPMPASVVAINVEPGQRVSRGDVLIVLEAMKMELPVKAPRDATVKAIACRAGELVQPGVPLLELE